MRLTLFVLAGAIGAALALQQATAQVFARKANSIALRIDPSYPGAYSRFAETVFAAGGGKVALPADVRRRLREVLKDEPLNRSALRLIALDAELRGQAGETRKLMTLSNRVSRRDVPTQLWLMQRAAAAGDWSTGLSHLNVILTVDSSLWKQVFPLITQNLGDRSIRDALVPLLRRDRPWTIPFLSDAVKTSRDPGAVAALLREAAPLPQAQGLRDVQGYVVARLIAVGQIEQARIFAEQVLDADSATFDQFALTARSIEPALRPLTWQFGDAEAVQVAREADGYAWIQTTATGGVSALTRYMPLPPGRYRVSYSAKSSQMQPMPSAEWAVQCPVGDRLEPIVTVPLRISDQRESFEFSVPSKCSGARFDVVSLGMPDGGPAELSVKPLSIKPV